MKSLIIVLLLCVIFSANVQAKKVQFTSATPGTVYVSMDENTCRYQCVDRLFQASYHVHRGTSVGLQLLMGDEVIDIIKTDFTTTGNGAKSWCRAGFSVPRDQDWALAWVLEKSSRKGRVIDVREMVSGHCPP